MQTHPLHAVAVPDFQLLLGLLEATVLLVVSRSLKVDVHIVGGLRSRRQSCKFQSRQQAVREQTIGPKQTDRLQTQTQIRKADSCAEVGVWRRELLVDL